MKSYADIKAQITRLEKEAELAREKELKEVIALIREKIAMYGLTSADLGLTDGKAKGKSKSALKPSASVPKYRDPKTGKTWTGHGKPPGWIAGAKNRNAFLIDGAPAAPAPVLASKKAAPKKASAKTTTRASSVAAKVSRKSPPAKRAAPKAAGVKAGAKKPTVKRRAVKQSAVAKTTAAPTPETGAEAPVTAG